MGPEALGLKPIGPEAGVTPRVARSLAQALYLAPGLPRWPQQLPDKQGARVPHPLVLLLVFNF